MMGESSFRAGVRIVQDRGRGGGGVGGVEVRGVHKAQCGIRIEKYQKLYMWVVCDPSKTNYHNILYDFDKNCSAHR